MKPLITALVDTYNHEKYIEQALVSVVEQGLSPSELEIVVVDDGSSDSTPSIIQKFVPRVKHIRKKNGGQASAFNAGFAEITSDIVSILDGDDWWAKGKLATVLDHLERNPDDSAVSHAYHEFYEESNETRFIGPQAAEFLNLATPEAARFTRQHWNHLQPSALTVRRKLLDRVMPIPETLTFCADGPITTAAMAAGTRVLPQPLSYYRIHPDNLHAGEVHNPLKLRRKLDAEDVMLSVLHARLPRLGVPQECVSILLDDLWIEGKRRRLRTFGGSRLGTFRTEMRAFQLGYQNPTLAYRLFKYLVMGSATLLLPPGKFYELHDWYGQHKLGRFRDWIFGTERTAHDGSCQPKKSTR